MNALNDTQRAPDAPDVIRNPREAIREQIRVAGGSARIDSVTAVAERETADAAERDAAWEAQVLDEIAAFSARVVAEQASEHDRALAKADRDAMADDGNDGPDTRTVEQQLADARAFAESERLYRLAMRRTMQPTREERICDLIAFCAAAIRWMGLGPFGTEHELHLALYGAQRLHLGRMLRLIEAEDLAVVSRRIWAALAVVGDTRRLAA